MVLPIIGDLLAAGLKIIDKVIPDPAAKAAAQLEYMRLQQAGEFKQLEADLQYAQGQIDIDKIEAGSNDPFKSNWRPFVGWVCGVGFAVQFVIGPLGSWIAALYGHNAAFPNMDVATMMPLLFGMLGLGAYRSFEKAKGVA